MTTSSLRDLPSVDKTLQALDAVDLPRPIVVGLVRRALDQYRHAGEVPPFDAIVAQLSQHLAGLSRARIQPVINGTGVLIHTNLGRAPLGPGAVNALVEAAGQYTNLEYDLENGERGKRSSYLDECLAMLCDAGAAAVVNNCAAALVLILRHLCTGSRREVIISRGELVQIGGGFRIPEILETAGATLREVGTTNTTDIDDYRNALNEKTALILKVHRSNFFMGGFVASPDTPSLASLAQESKIPLVQDLGSGAVMPSEAAGLQDHEPTPAESLRSGVDIVCFSGDKLFGGPQAGIIAGKAEWIAGIRKEPMFRAMRCDKLILAALQSVTDVYLAGEAHSEIPVWSMMRESVDTLQARADTIINALPDRVHTVQCKAQVGGGTLPQAEIESVALDIVPGTQSLNALSSALRQSTPPIIGYISQDRFLIDLRTVLPAQDAVLMEQLKQIL